MWLVPFFPSPSGDDGYDIIGFYGGAPPVGELGEWWPRSALPRTAGDHRDLVVDPSPASIPGPARLDPCSLKKGETIHEGRRTSHPRGCLASGEGVAHARGRFADGHELGRDVTAGSGSTNPADP